METSIDSLRNSSLSSDDSRLVDSILNDLNGPSQNQGPPSQSQPQGQAQPPQMSPEQQKMMLEQRQQQIMMQQMAAQRQQQQQQQQANVLRNKNVSLLDDLKNESGKLFVILVLIKTDFPISRAGRACFIKVWSKALSRP